MSLLDPKWKYTHSTATDIRIAGTPEVQTETLPLDLTVADFG